jgi:acetyl-CoA acetyltransferase family protein
MSNSMKEAVIVEAVRSPLGKRNGGLAGIHPADLAAQVLRDLIKRSGIDSALVDDVIMGCVLQVGEQSLNIARNAALGAGFPDTVPGTTVDRQCGSAQQAVHFAAQGVMAGAYDVVIAAGVESMSRVPMFSNVNCGPGRTYGEDFRKRYGVQDDVINQGVSADLIARKWGFDRTHLEKIAVESHARANRAQQEGRFEGEIVPITINDDSGERIMSLDECIRPATSLEALANLRPAFGADGLHTAGSSSQISDGAAALLIMSREKAEALGLRPRARFVNFALAGADPVTMLTAPIPATQKVLKLAGMSMSNIDLVELNEAFASVVAAWLHEIKADPAKVNVNGGAIALGHPVGCSGTRLMVTLLNELERRDGQFGLQTMCEGGGMANATIIERI